MAKAGGPNAVVLREATRQAGVSPNAAYRHFANQSALLDGVRSACISQLAAAIEDEMKKIGANYVQAGLWRGFAIRDGNLVTGQQNFSGSETAEAVVKALGE